MPDRNYVLGFAFNTRRDRVLLIEKRKPEWQAGLLNGVGGKIESYDQSPRDALVREFREEAGVDTANKQWSNFVIMTGTDWQKDKSGKTIATVHCYELADDYVFNLADTCEEEPIAKVYVDTILSRVNHDLLVPNLPILIPLARDRMTFQRPVTLNWRAP